MNGSIKARFMVLIVGAGDSRYVLLHGHGGRTLPVSSYTWRLKETIKNSLVTVNALFGSLLCAQVAFAVSTPAGVR